MPCGAAGHTLPDGWRKEDRILPLSCNSLHNKYCAAICLDPLSVAAIAAAVYFFDFRTLAALLCAAAVHELGHAACLRAFGLKLAGFHTEGQGLCIEYAGSAGHFVHAAAAAAGPAAGLALAYAASWAGAELLAGVSLLLTLFNLLPVLPLDGGRIMCALLIVFMGETRGARAAQMCSVAMAYCIVAAGVYLMLSGRGAALFVTALWLLFSQESSLPARM